MSNHKSQNEESRSSGELYNEYYRNRAPSAFGRKVLRAWHARMHAQAEQVIPNFRSLRICEIGAGSGFFCEVCKERGSPYVGIEMNAAQAEELRSRGFDVSAGAVPPLEVSGKIQLVWLSHMLEHARDWLNASEIVAAVHDKLDPGGYVVVIGPDVLSWKNYFWDVDWSHGYPTTLNRVEQLLNDTGFEIEASFHHTATFRNPLVAWILDRFFRLVPYRLFDAILKPLSGRRFGSAFMSHYGLRQIFIAGRKKP